MKTKTFFTAIALTIGLLWSGPLRANDSVPNVADESEISSNDEETEVLNREKGYFRIEKAIDKNLRIQLVKVNSEAQDVQLVYCLSENGDWKALKPGSAITLRTRYVYLRAENTNESLDGYRFESANGFQGDFYLSGNLMSLLDKDMEKKSVPANAFRNLFKDWTKIIRAEGLELPATQLGENCYEGMFEGCSNLESAPKLPAETLAKGCYKNMFKGCTKLDYLEANFSDWNVEDATTDWLSGVAEKGVFFYQGDSSVVRSASTVPDGWVVNPDYFTFTAEKENVGVYLSGVESRPDVSVQYSVDRYTWVDYKQNNVLKTLAHVGDKLYWRAADKNPSLQGLNFKVFQGKAKVSGNIMSLLDATCQQKEVPANAFRSLFAGCQGLSKAPALPATQLGDSCYAYMFQSCDSLTEAPELPATQLSKACYLGMFQKCEALKKAPALPATELADSCYADMFQGCKSLTETPVLPATQMATGCYLNMFSDCKNLSKVYLAATDLTEAEAMGWLSGVSATGIFYCPEEFQNDTHESSGMWGKPSDSGWKFNAYKSRVQLNAQGYATYSTPLAQRIVKGGEVATCRVNGVVVEAEPVGTNIPAGEGVLLVGEPNATVELETLVFAYAPTETEALIQSDLTPATTVDVPFEALPATGYIYLLRKDKFEAWFDANGTKTGSEKYCGQDMAYLELDKPANAASLNIVKPEMTLRTADATISECGYTTLCVAFNAAVPEGATVYALRRIDAEGLHFSKVNALVAKEGYIVEGTVGQTYTFTEVYDDVVDQNLLQGVAEEAFVSSLGFWGYTQENNLYDYPWILAKDGTFKRYTGSIIPAGKAYVDGKLLQNNELAANVMRVLLEETAEDETTAIAPLDAADVVAAEYYSLEGCRLAQLRRGALCIERGRKIILEK